MDKNRHMMQSLGAVLQRGRIFLLIFLICQSVAAVYAATVTGVVVRVADGDTLTLLDEKKAQHKVRLAGIDAPEKKQAFGTRAKQSLSDAAYKKYVTVEAKKKDRYGRLLGKVFHDGKDLGLLQIRQGLAWHYTAYEKDQSPEDRVAYKAAEMQARTLRQGLWVDPSPVPPWKFRRQPCRFWCKSR